MYLIFGLSTLFLLSVIVDETSACGGRKHRPPPPPCHWETCRASYAGWSGATPTGDNQCVTQIQRCHHHKQRHQRHGGCPGSTHCHQRDHHRRWCKCIVYKIVGWTDWKQMPGQEGKNPKQFERIAQYAKDTSKHPLFQGSCGGLHGPHHPQKQHDMFHDCKHFKEASWSGWEELPGSEVCKTYVRKMNYENAATTVEKKCHPHTHGPHNPREERQQRCCKSLVHNYGDWTPWKPTGKQEGQCVEVKRFRQHKFHPVMVGYGPDGKCPAIPQPAGLVETDKQCF